MVHVGKQERRRKEEKKKSISFSKPSIFNPSNIDTLISPGKSIENLEAITRKPMEMIIIIIMTKNK